MGNITSAKSKPAATSIIDVTYADLMVLINGSDLIPSAKYRITDYATVHYMLDGNGGICLDGNSDPYINTGTTEPLIVCAVSANQLDKIAHSATYPQDIIYYDPNPANWLLDLAFGKTDSDLVTGFKGVIYYREDTKNKNSIPEDFRNNKYRRWQKNTQEWAVDVTYAKGDKVQTAVGLYGSKTSGNVGNLTTDTTKWEKLIDYSINGKYQEYNISNAKDTGDFVDYKMFAGTESDYNKDVICNSIKSMRDDLTYQDMSGTILGNNVIFLKANAGYFQFYNNHILSGFFSNTIGNNIFYNNIGVAFSKNLVDSEMDGNTIGSNFNSNIIPAFFSGNNIQQGGNSTYCRGFKYNSTYIGGQNYLGATHAAANYRCTIQPRADGTAKLSYINNSDVLVITDATA